MDAVFWWIGVLVSSWISISVLVVLGAMAWELGMSLKRVALVRGSRQAVIVAERVTA